MAYTWNTFLKPLSVDDRVIQILDKTGKIKFTIDPFSIINVSISNNLIKINFKNDSISIAFSSTNESKSALPLLQEQIISLKEKNPLYVDKKMENYVDSQNLQGPQGFQGNQGLEGFQGNQGLEGFQGNQGKDGLQGNQGWQGNAGTGTQGNQGIGSNNIVKYFPSFYDGGVNSFTIPDTQNDFVYVFLSWDDMSGSVPTQIQIIVPSYNQVKENQIIYIINKSIDLSGCSLEIIVSLSFGVSTTNDFVMNSTKIIYATLMNADGWTYITN
jgi:hypothetical protein